MRATFELSGLDTAIELKVSLLRRLGTTDPALWLGQVSRFVAALDCSDLTNETALVVLLSDLGEQLRRLLGVSETSGCEAAHRGAEESTLGTSLALRPDLPRREILARFQQYVLQVLLPVAGARLPVSPIAREVKRIIDRRYPEPLTLDALADAVGRSKRQVASVFRREYGASVHDYLISVRLNQALALIREGAKIEAVSLLVGYRSRKNFYRHFKARLGVMPRAYRAALFSASPLHSIRHHS